MEHMACQANLPHSKLPSRRSARPSQPNGAPAARHHQRVLKASADCRHGVRRGRQLCCAPPLQRRRHPWHHEGLLRCIPLLNGRPGKLVGRRRLRSQLAVLSVPLVALPAVEQAGKEGRGGRDTRSW